MSGAGITKGHRLGGLNKRSLFSHSSGDWSSRSWYQHGQMVSSG